MVKQDGRDPVAKCEPHPIVENGRGPLDHGPELRVGVGAMDPSVVIIIGQEIPMHEERIIDAGSKEFGKRSPGQGKGLAIRLTDLSDPVMCVDRWEHRLSGAVLCKAPSALSAVVILLFDYMGTPPSH